VRKQGTTETFLERIRLLAEHGYRVVLNVLGGLPRATKTSYALTREFIDESLHHVFLYNFYNFVPYPKAPIFATLRPRIVDWTFSNWREDGMVVYSPYLMSREEHWECFLDLVDYGGRVLRSKASAEGVE
jgi:hypothetical protein